MAKQIDVDLEFLREEYFHLQSTVESFDEKALTIKAWSITLSMVGVGAAFTSKLPVLLLLASVASLLFWLIEALWKSFQQANYYRLRTIEDFMRGEDVEDFSAPDIVGSWSVAWRETSLLTILSWSHVFLPHAIVVVFGPVCWFLDRYLDFLPK